MLSQKGYTASGWLNNGISILNGYTGGKCSDASVSAYTTIGGTTVYACTQFSNLTSGWAAVTLIHEELHTLGLSENPPDPNAMTPNQINQYVVSNCGT